jgi:hypothetical protein
LEYGIQKASNYSMSIILVILAVLLVGGLIASGIMYSWQQAIAQREHRIRSLRQKYEELQGLFDLIFQADSEADIAVVLNQAMLDIARQIRSVDSKNPETQLLVNQLSTRGTALNEGLLLPEGKRVMTAEASLNSLLSGYASILQKLQRLKIRGLIATHQYDAFSTHLRNLTLETEVESHLASAEMRLANGDRLKAANHFRHARELLKKTNLEVENKNERIREISEKLKQAESEEPPKQSDSIPTDTSEKPAPAQPGQKKKPA